MRRAGRRASVRRSNLELLTDRRKVRRTDPARVGVARVLASVLTRPPMRALTLAGDRAAPGHRIVIRARRLTKVTRDSAPSEKFDDGFGATGGGGGGGGGAGGGAGGPGGGASTAPGPVYLKICRPKSRSEPAISRLPAASVNCSTPQK